VSNLCASPQAAPSCTDGIRNGTETDVDCGGSCPPCLDGRSCLVGADCAAQICSATGRCVTPPTVGPPDTGGAQVYHIDPGAGVVVQPGTQAGYGITANFGASYRIVWTGDGVTQYREFYGSLWTSGVFTSLSPGCEAQACPLGANDYVSQPYDISGGQRIDFDTFATSGIEGFDFAVSLEPVYFDLYIDGQHYPELVFFSSAGAQSSTAGFPFGLTTM
jgi:hypothetical protein